MQIVIEIPEQIYLNAKADMLCGADILVSAIKNGTLLPPHGDLIDRDALIAKGCYWETEYEMLKQPTILETTKGTGHWIAIDEEPHEDYECDRCGYMCSTFTANIKPSEEYKYCPNCGARMVEAKGEE